MLKKKGRMPTFREQQQKESARNARYKGGIDRERERRREGERSHLVCCDDTVGVYRRYVATDESNKSNRQ